MQIANTLNNTIRILFNPKVESFRLFDFLVVKSLDDRYLAQIIEIYEDKFDSSQNVAKLKLFYKITPNNEVIPYDNFNPGKECEISKVKPEEVEKFINGDKETFIFATNTKNSQGLNLQYDFFNKNAIVLADKIENANAVSLNLAKKLSAKRHCVVIDFTGVVEFEEAKKIAACKNFKLPLNFNTIDLVFDRCLSDASLEFQAAGCEIQNAIKNYAKKQEDGFISFSAFLHVLIEQYKATPYPELQLMLARMRKYQMSDIFAKSRKDYLNLSETVQKNEITIIDLSGLGFVWQKAYMEYIASELQDEIYLIARINDETFDTDLINKIYNKKPNIKFVPNASYNYAKLPSIIQYCKNYILLPSLYQRNDFLDANFALSNLVSQECIIFGENTDGFLYIARDYELEIQEKRKNYRKIALSMIENEEGAEKPQEKDKISDSQKLIEELSNLEESSIKEYELENDETEETQEVVSKDEFNELNQEEKPEEVQDTACEIETIKKIQEVKLSNEPVKYENEVQNEQTEVKQDNAETENAQIQPETVKRDTTPIRTPEEIDISDEELDFFELAENSAAFENQKNVVVGDVEYKVQSDNFDSEEETRQEKPEEEPKSEEVKPEEVESEGVNLEDLIQEEVKEPEKTEDVSLESNEEIDLSEFADNAIENNFEEVINSKQDTEKQVFEIDENTKVQIDLETENNDLPIFKEEEKQEEDNEKPKYAVGDKVIHKKYGRGEIIKIIPHGNNQLLQIEFEDSNTGKKLLDPKIAQIQLEQ